MRPRRVGSNHNQFKLFNLQFNFFNKKAASLATNSEALHCTATLTGSTKLRITKSRRLKRLN